MKILLAITESASSEAAVDEVRKRFWPSGTTVRVLHLVGDFVPPAQQLWYGAGGSHDRAKEDVAHHYRELTESTAKTLQQVGLTVETIVRDGNPRKAIVAAAKEWGADLIVMGSQHHSAVAGLLLGNIAQTVMNHARCPVEIVPASSRQLTDT
jgi:nucleotide-binding universal stress UspA family protein